MKNETQFLTLRKLEDKDISLVEKWINQDYILKWYHEPEEWIREMRERNGEFSFLSHYIVEENDNPFAFCQYYDCFDAQEDWYSVRSSGHTFSIDYLIGDQEYLGKGYAKMIIKALIEKVKSHPDAKKIVVQPEMENIASCRTLLSNGFLFDDELQYYYLYL